MSTVAALVQRRIDRISMLTGELGRRVVLDVRDVLDRSNDLALKPPGRTSANGSCQIMLAADGWIALTLARSSDIELIPALIGSDVQGDPVSALRDAVASISCNSLINQGALLGLPLSHVGETLARPRGDSFVVMSGSDARPFEREMSVVDLSSLWAGPLCGAVLAGVGAQVVKIESRSRPDPTWLSTPALHHRLNGVKTSLKLDVTSEADLVELRRRVASADVLITSARPRAFESFGLTAEKVWTDNPGLIWVAVTGHGWWPPNGDRVAFGDDAAAAGGLVSWTSSGEPMFMGDALADPLTGLQAAIWTLDAIKRGQGGLIDAALSGCAALATLELQADG